MSILRPVEAVTIEYDCRGKRTTKVFPNQFKKYHGNDEGQALVWKCPSRTMNPTLSQKIIDDAMADDLAAAKSEYFGEFRDDVGIFLPSARRSR
jgi:hypothetical protein